MSPTTSASMVFVQSLNPMTGKMEWKSQPEDYDYQQELARAAFADMLHDSERNQFYYRGLKAAIDLKRSQGQPVHVLDIGTGTGLLSMMAAKIGADSITAIEEFMPMAKRAQKIIRDNGFAEQIKLVTKRSTGVKVGPNLDMERRANILVTEVFDTELIGEGAISTFNHAHEHLLTQDCLVVPHTGRLYAQVVSSDLCSKWNGVQDISEELLVPEAHKCSGAKTLALHDLQLSQLEEAKGHFTPLSDAMLVFNFDFGQVQSKKAIEKRRQSVKWFEPKSTEMKCDAIFMWWDLIFDPKGELVLSCAPNWAKSGDHPKDDMAWRDHWMQAIYYPISSHKQLKERMYLVSNHDEYSYWFDIMTSEPKSLVEMPSPKAGIHLAVSRTRLGQLNDQEYNEKLTRSVQKCLESLEKTSNLSIFVLSEQSFLPLIVANMIKSKGGKVLCQERNDQFRTVLSDIAKHNSLESVLEIGNDQDSEDYHEIGTKLQDRKFDLVLAEPSFGKSLLPWHNLFFWYMLKSFEATTTFMPKKAVLWTCPVTFDHLWKIRAPLNQVEGFDLSHFDEVIMKACDVSDAEVEPEPLWEYPCQALACPKPVMSFDFASEISKMTGSAEFEGLDVVKRGSGMVFWIEWHLTDDEIVHTGPVQPIRVGKTVQWNMHHKQGVHFFVEKDEAVKIHRISTQAIFHDGELSFTFTEE